MDLRACWVSQPDEWQPQFARWTSQSDLPVTLHDFPQYGGEVVRGLTLGNPEAEFRLVVAVPHAHEPAQTAACVDLAWQLITGEHADGRPTALARDAILSHTLLTLLPDTNSQGRARAARRVWDGELSNEEFLRIAFGIAADGSRFGRYDCWRVSEHRPRWIGIEYEGLDDDRYVEPNTDRRSTHCRAIDALFARYRYTHYLDLHQHEGNEAVLLPERFDRQPPPEQQAIRAWGEAIEAGWRSAGIHELGPMDVPYRGNPRQELFRKFWEGRCPGLLRLTVEVRNNRHRETGEPTPLERQFAAATAALAATVRHGLSWRAVDHGR